jgi:hypothetical protein
MDFLIALLLGGLGLDGKEFCHRDGDGGAGNAARLRWFSASGGSGAEPAPESGGIGDGYQVRRAAPAATPRSSCVARWCARAPPLPIRAAPSGACGQTGRKGARGTREALTMVCLAASQPDGGRGAAGGDLRGVWGANDVQDRARFGGRKRLLRVCRLHKREVSAAAV